MFKYSRRKLSTNELLHLFLTTSPGCCVGRPPDVAPLPTSICCAPKPLTLTPSCPSSVIPCYSQGTEGIRRDFIQAMVSTAGALGSGTPFYLLRPACLKIEHARSQVRKGGTTTAACYDRLMTNTTGAIACPRVWSAAEPISSGRFAREELGALTQTLPSRPASPGFASTSLPALARLVYATAALLDPGSRVAPFGRARLGERPGAVYVFWRWQSRRALELRHGRNNCRAAKGGRR